MSATPGAGEPDPRPPQRQAARTGPLLGRLLGPYRGLPASCWALFFATMVNRFGDFVGLFLTLYLTQIQKLDSAQAGAFVGLAFALSMVGALISGRLADRWGRKRVLLGAQTLAALLMGLTGWFLAEAWAPALILASMVFRGAARPLIGALLTDLAPPERRKEVFTLQYWSINVGVAVGPLVAARLFNQALPWLFWGDALAALLGVILVARGAKLPPLEATLGSVREHPETRGAFGALLRRPLLLGFIGIGFLGALTYSQTNFGLALRLNELFGTEEGNTWFGWLVSVNAVTVLVLSLPLARLVRSWSPLACTALGGGLFALGLGAFAWPLPGPGLVAATLVWTLGEIFNSLQTGVFLARHSPANRRGAFQSYLGFAFQAGWAISPALVGALLPLLGSPPVWLGLGGLCLLWGGAAFVLSRWDQA